MSPRAAWRLEGLGFERVYRYTTGKMDWFDTLASELVGVLRREETERALRAGT